MAQTWTHQVILTFSIGGRLWRDVNLSKLSCITYPAGHSAHNPIEHAWSPLSNALTGVVLPAVLPGEDKSHNKQSALTKEEMRCKNAQMLDNAGKLLKAHWEKLRYDNNAVVPIPIKSVSDNSEPYNDRGVIERFVYAALRDLDGGDIELQALRKEFKFLCRHADRRNNALAFLKCQLFKPSGQECHHCTSNPPSPCSAYDYEKSIGGFMFDPVPSEEHDGHFKTYLEMVSMENSNYKGEPQELGRCAICPNWWYSSQTEIKRHRRILHPKVPMEDIVAGDSKYNTKESKLFYCRFKLNGKICNLTFSSYHQLYTHRNKCGHKRNRQQKLRKRRRRWLQRRYVTRKKKLKRFFNQPQK